MLSPPWCLCTTVIWRLRWTWGWKPLRLSGDGMDGQQGWVIPPYPCPPQLCLPIVCLPFFCLPAKPCSVCPHSLWRRGVIKMNPARLSDEALSFFQPDSTPLLSSIQFLTLSFRSAFRYTCGVDLWSQWTQQTKRPFEDDLLDTNNKYILTRVSCVYTKKTRILESLQ